MDEPLAQEEWRTGSGPRTLHDVVHQVVAEVAPQELEVLPLLERKWSAGRLTGRRRRWAGGSVGFGLDPVLVAQALLTVLGGALSEVIGTATVSGVRGWRRGRRRRTAPPPDRIPVSPPASFQAQGFRDDCVAHLTTAGLSRKSAELAADAALGVLLRQLLDAPVPSESADPPAGGVGPAAPGGASGAPRPRPDGPAR